MDPPRHIQVLRRPRPMAPACAARTPKFERARHLPHSQASCPQQSTARPLLDGRAGDIKPQSPWWWGGTSRLNACCYLGLCLRADKVVSVTPGRRSGSVAGTHEAQQTKCCIWYVPSTQLASKEEAHPSAGLPLKPHSVRRATTSCCTHEGIGCRNPLQRCSS